MADEITGEPYGTNWDFMFFLIVCAVVLSIIIGMIYNAHGNLSTLY